MKNRKKIVLDDLDDILREAHKDPEAKRLFDEYGRQLEIAYKMLQLRKARCLRQKELAAKVGTTQSNVARLEGGNQNFTIKLLGRFADALGAELKIELKG